MSLGRDKVPVAFGFETGRIARLANGAVMASMGDTRVMCAAVTAREPDPNASFFNLNVEYRERASAWGKIPGTFTRREGPYKDREVLAMRVVDRALRPLFPKAFKNETSVQAIVLSTDRSQDPAVLAVNGASARWPSPTFPGTVPSAPFASPWWMARLFSTRVTTTWRRPTSRSRTRATSAAR